MVGNQRVQYRLPFGKEQFKRLIINTYEEWYGHERLQSTLADYMKAVIESDLENSIGRFLESNDSNPIDLDNMPLIDLGDKPSSFDPHSSESGQIFLIPKSHYPDRLIIKYGEFKPEFKLDSLSKKYKKTSLYSFGIDYLAFENTVSNASRLLLPYRSYITRLERLNFLICLLGFLLAIACSVLGGTLYSWVSSLLIVLGYFLLVALSYFLFKKLQNRSLRQCHLVLALYCRAENNRLFLDKSVEVRPGFLGMWLEFICHTKSEGEEGEEEEEDWLIERIRRRVLPERYIRKEESK